MIYEDTAFSDNVKDFIAGLGIPALQRPEDKEEYHNACINFFDEVYSIGK